MSALGRASALLAILFSSGCAQTVSVELVFMFSEDFDRTDQLALTVVPVREGVTCETLRQQAGGSIPGAELIVSIRPVCDFNERFSIDGVTEGPKFYLVHGVDAAGTVVTSGCRQHDVFADPTTVRIFVAGTDLASMDGTDYPTRSCP